MARNTKSALNARMQVTPDPNWSFRKLLDWHIHRGTRADGNPQSVGVPWEAKEFARAVGKASSEGVKSDRTIRNWRNGETLPGSADLHGILQALFGGKPAYAEWQSAIGEKYHAALACEGDDSESAVQLRKASIPSRPLRCLGRDDDLKSIVGALTTLQKTAAILVLGGPGVGKTTLTRQAANDPTVVEKFGRCRWFIELEIAKDLQSFETAIITALGLDPTNTKFDGAMEYLVRTPGLLILDNLETPWEADMAGVERRLGQLAATPGLVLLASIRGGEAPAGLRWTRRKTVEPLEAPHDRDLFLDIAQDIPPDDPDLAPLLADLGGIPLAIELVAMQAQTAHSLKPVRDEWRRVGSALAQRPRAAGSRLTSLDISLELSFASPRTDDAGRRLFAILGQLPAGIAAEDVNTLLGKTAFEARQALLASGLGHERDGRLDLLPPVRDHAQRLHPPSGVDADAWPRHFFELARGAGQHIRAGHGGDIVKRLTPAMPNFDAALNAVVAAGKLDNALTAIESCALLMRFTGCGIPTAIRTLGDACRRAGDCKGEADCHRNLGDIELRRSNSAAARQDYEVALRLYKELGDNWGEAVCMARLGDIALRCSDHEIARKAYEHALPLFRQVGNVLGEANCIFSLGELALGRSDHDAARKALEQALPLYRHISDLLGEANCIGGLGVIALGGSDHNTARMAFEQALPLFQQVGEFQGEANCMQGLGDIALERADYDAAHKFYEQALPLFRRIGAVLGEANCIKGDGNVAFACSDLDTARDRYEEALPLFRKVGAIQGEAGCIRSLGDIALERSDRDAARKRYEEALPLFRKVGDLLGQANCLASLGGISLLRSDTDAARKAYEEALTMYERIAEPYSIGHTHRRLASLCKGKERASHLEAARAAWMSIDRPDLVATLEE